MRESLPALTYEVLRAKATLDDSHVVGIAAGDLRLLLATLQRIAEHPLTGQVAHPSEVAASSMRGLARRTLGIADG